MKHLMDLFISLLAGTVIALVGIYLVGYTAAFAMPTWFSPAIFLWDLLVVQLLSFGLASLLGTYLVVRLVQVNPIFLFAISLTAIVVAPKLLYGGSINIYWLNLLVVAICLSFGCFLGKKMHSKVSHDLPHQK